MVGECATYRVVQVLVYFSVELEPIGQEKVVEIGVIGGGYKGRTIGGILEDVSLVQLSENVGSVDADGKMMEEFVGIGPVGPVDAAMSCNKLIGDLGTAATLEVIRIIVFVVLWTVGE